MLSPCRLRFRQPPELPVLCPEGHPFLLCPVLTHTIAKKKGLADSDGRLTSGHQLLHSDAELLTAHAPGTVGVQNLPRQHYRPTSAKHSPSARLANASTANPFDERDNVPSNLTQT